MDIFADLEAEQDRLEVILAGLDDSAWTTGSGAPGWTVLDVVLHLAQSEEAVVAAAAGGRDWWAEVPAGKLDESMDRLVRAERAPPHAVFERWRSARRAALRSLHEADPRQPLPWAVASLRPPTLATTRLAEHWAHGLDITGPLGVPFPDTGRLWHVAWLAHRSLPYAFALAGVQPQEVFCDLTGPDGTAWRYGPPEAESRITGSAGAFCRVGARRLPPDESGLTPTGPHGATALRVLRNYAA